MESTFALTCLGLITLAAWVALGVLFVAFIEMRRAFLAVEAVAYRLMDTAEKLHHATLKVEDFATHVRSGWMRAFEVAVGAAQTFWPKHKAEPPSEGHNGGGERGS